MNAKRDSVGKMNATVPTQASGKRSVLKTNFKKGIKANEKTVRAVERQNSISKMNVKKSLNQFESV